MSVIGNARAPMEYNVGDRASVVCLLRALCSRISISDIEAIKRYIGRGRVVSLQFRIYAAEVQEQLAREDSEANAPFSWSQEDFAEDYTGADDEFAWPLDAPSSWAIEDSAEDYIESDAYSPWSLQDLEEDCNECAVTPSYSFSARSSDTTVRTEDLQEIQHWDAP